jgi:hypothetical protein
MWPVFGRFRIRLNNDSIHRCESGDWNEKLTFWLYLRDRCRETDEADHAGLVAPIKAISCISRSTPGAANERGVWCVNLQKSVKSQFCRLSISMHCQRRVITLKREPRWASFSWYRNRFQGRSLWIIADKVFFYAYTVKASLGPVGTRIPAPDIWFIPFRARWSRRELSMFSDSLG